MKKAAIALAIASTCLACEKLRVNFPPVPPNWGDQCTPDSSEYIDMAWDNQDKPPKLLPGTTPQQAKAESLERLKGIGYELIVGRPPGYEYATDENFGGVTLPGHVYVSEGNKKVMDKDETGVMWAGFVRHEETHANQQVRLGASFFSYYALSEGKLLTVETPAYDAEYSTYAFFAEQNPEFDVLEPTFEMFKESAAFIYKKYNGSHMPVACFKQIAAEVWTKENR